MLNATTKYKNVSWWLKALFHLIILLLPLVVKSQDTLRPKKEICGDVITFNNGTTQRAKIYEINSSEVVFKRCANLNGPFIRINKSHVKSIVYANEIKETFTVNVVREPIKEELPKPAPAATIETVDISDMKVGQFDTIYPRKKVFPYDLTQHFISVDVFAGLTYKMPTLSYEYIFARGKLGTRIHFALGTQFNNTRPSMPYLRKGTRRAVGLDFNCYLFEGNFYPGSVKCFMGPSLEYGVFNYTRTESKQTTGDSIFSGFPPVFSYVETIYETNTSVFEGYYYNLMLKGGFLCRPTVHFNISLCGGFGWLIFNKTYAYRDRLMVRFEVNMGYKF
jgi:hypothetical protein